MWTKLWTIKMSDWERGLVVAILSAPLTIIYQSIQAGLLTFNWEAILTAGVTAGIAYILKNLTTGQAGNLFTNK